MRDLESTWTGKAIFTAAYLQTLARARPRPSPTPRVSSDPTPTPTRAPAPRVRRGKNVAYMAGPMTHKRGKNGANWTNYMVRTILSCGSTKEAEEKHATSGVYQDKKLDFNWMFKNQFITKVD